MALNFNLLNRDLPEQIAGSFQQGYQGAQERANVLEQREQQKRDRVARIIQDGAKAIVATPGAYKSVFARVNKVAGVPLDDDERRYDEAFATGGEDAVKKLAMADANFDIQTVLSLRDREAYEAYLKGQQPAAMPSAAPSVAQNVDLNKYPPVNPLITSIGLSQPKAQRVTNALDPSIIERVGLSPQTTNALAPTPTAQAPVAPVNALVSAPVDKRTAIQNEIAQLLNFNDPRAAVRIRQLEQQLTAMEPRVVGGSVYYPDTGEFKTPAKPSSKLIQVSINGQPVLVPEEQAAGMTPFIPSKVGRGAAPSAGGARAAAPSDGKIDKVLTDETGRTRFFNKFGKEITPVSATGEPIAVQGKPSATFEKTRAQQQQLSKDIDSAVKQLTDITKEGGLIDQSTGSGIGRLIDIGAGFIGQATPGAIATSKLAPIADIVLKMVPRFEGPQSDKDTQSYKEAAGQLANPSLPSDVRKAAGLEILRLMKERRNQFVTQSMADQGIPPTPTAPNIDALLEKYK